MVILVIRYVYLSATTLKIKPSALVYMSPRGLISILLFIQLKEVSFLNTTTSPIDERVLLVVILGSMLVMLLGTLKKPKNDGIIISDLNTEEEEEGFTFDSPSIPPSLDENENETTDNS